MFAFLDLGLETDLLICVLCRRSVSGVDIDPDLVHMEMQDASGGTFTFGPFFAGAI